MHSIEVSFDLSLRWIIVWILEHNAQISWIIIFMVLFLNCWKFRRVWIIWIWWDEIAGKFPKDNKSHRNIIMIDLWPLSGIFNLAQVKRIKKISARMLWLRAAGRDYTANCMTSKQRHAHFAPIRRYDQQTMTPHRIQYGHMGSPKSLWLSKFSFAVCPPDLSDWKIYLSLSLSALAVHYYAIPSVKEIGNASQRGIRKTFYAHRSHTCPLSTPECNHFIVHFIHIIIIIMKCDKKKTDSRLLLFAGESQCDRILDALPRFVWKRLRNSAIQDRHRRVATESSRRFLPNRHSHDNRALSGLAESAYAVAMHIQHGARILHNCRWAYCLLHCYRLTIDMHA